MIPEKRPELKPLLVSAFEAARALSLSTRTLWSMTQAGTIPHVRIGRRVLYSPADLQGWIDRQKGPLKAVENNSEVNT